MRLTVIGCSPAWPNPGGAQSGYLVEHEGTRVLLDCGPGVLARLREREEWPRLDAIVVTHFHLDHFGDLVPWVWGARFGAGASVESPQLWLPPEGSATLARIGELLGGAAMFETVFALREYAEREPFRVGALEVTPVRVPHYDTPTWALRVSDGNATLAYSADSGPAHALAEVADGADLFLCEATLDEVEPEPRGHLTVEEAAAAAAGARRLVLVHRPHERGAPGGFELAQDGAEYTVA